MAETFTFCPRCAARLTEKMHMQALRPVCPACGFVQFHDPKVAVIGLVRRPGHVLLVQRAVDPAKGKWSLPGGYMDAGEMPQSALQRELLEEVGLRVEITAFLDVYPMTTPDGDRIGIVLAYQARPAGSPAIPYVADDVQAAGWFTPGNLPHDLAFESTRALLQAWQESDITSG